MAKQWTPWRGGSWALLALAGCGKVEMVPASTTPDGSVLEPCGDVSSRSAFFQANRADASHDPIEL